MNEIISVIFNDGSRWDNLTLDGSSLVSKKPLDPSKIDNCPENLKIVDSEGEIIFMFDYALISSYGGPNEIGEYYVAIYPLTSEKMRECEVNSKLDYLSLMTGIDLENEIEKVRTISNERGGGAQPEIHNSYAIFQNRSLGRSKDASCCRQRLDHHARIRDYYKVEILTFFCCLAPSLKFRKGVSQHED